MNILTGFTTQPKQETTVALQDGSKVTILLEYRPQQRGWFFDIEWQDFKARGIRLTSSPNILRQYRKLIPFGIATEGANAADALRQNDLADGTITLILLDAYDVQSIEATIYEIN